MILMTGATGLGGAAIARAFVAQGVPLRALVRDKAKAEALDLGAIDVVKGDMSKPETLGAALSGVEQALLISTADERMEETQCRFIDACARFGVAHVVKFSGAETGMNAAGFRFTAMHERIEDYLERSGLKWTHLRPSQFMQVYLREARTIVGRGELRLPAGGVSLAPIDIADIAAITVEMMRRGGHDGRSYPMTGPEALTMEEVAHRISEATGRPVRYVPISPEERREIVLAAGASPYFADALFEQAVERLKNPHAQVHLETHREFGVAPTRFRDFVRRHATEFGG